jgi:hypothetical protein
MTLYHFSVTQLRIAATCPRIHYFDVEYSRARGLKTPACSRIWKTGRSEAAGGNFFHNIIDRFNSLAASSPEIETVLERATELDTLWEGLMQFLMANCVPQEALLEKSAILGLNLSRVLQRYLREVAELLLQARGVGIPPKAVLQEVFGDPRRRIDVTFQLGEPMEPVQVTGAVDYLYFDPLQKRLRIVDYKLKPADQPNHDLFQVSACALMHHHQYGTQPDVGVLYLHPQRQLVESPWQQVYDLRGKVYDLLASMVPWAAYDEHGQTGLKPPGDITHCVDCKWNKLGQCEQRLGPKDQGAYEKRWEELSARGTLDAPKVDALAPSDTPLEEEEETPNEPEESVTQPEGHLFLGMAGTAPVFIPFNVLNTHVAVVGAAGSGKTWLAKVMAEEAIAAGVPVLAIDPQGDLVQFLEGRPLQDVPHAYRKAAERFRERVEPRIYTPGTSHGIRLSLDPLHLPSKAGLERVDPKHRKEEEDGLFSSLASNVVHLARIKGDSKARRAFVFRALKLLAERGDVTPTLRDVVELLRDPAAYGFDDADYLLTKTERNKLAQGLYALAAGPSSRLFQDGDQVLSMEALLTPTVSGKVPLNVFYLNALGDDDEKHFFVATLASEIYRWMVTEAPLRAGLPNLLFYLDEARDFLPAGAHQPPAKASLLRLFAQGRKYGVACLVCTQSPRSLDYNAFGNISTKIVGRMESAQDTQRIAQWFEQEGEVPQWVSGRNGATKGTFVGRWPNQPEALEGAVFEGRMLYSCHERAWNPDQVYKALARSRE